MMEFCLLKIGTSVLAVDMDKVKLQGVPCRNFEKSALWEIYYISAEEF